MRRESCGSVTCSATRSRSTALSASPTASEFSSSSRAGGQARMRRKKALRLSNGPLPAPQGAPPGPRCSRRSPRGARRLRGSRAAPARYGLPSGNRVLVEPERVRALPVLVLLLALCGCAELHFGNVSYARPFQFDEDTFIFPNELVWAYQTEPNGAWKAKSRNPEPDYTHQCFVLARSARQFFQHARFDPTRPEPDEEHLRALVRKGAATDPRVRRDDDEPIVIPGFGSLRALSDAHGSLLREELGGSIWSYIQRGNWRLRLPFTRRHQARTGG